MLGFCHWYFGNGMMHMYLLLMFLHECNCNCGKIYLDCYGSIPNAIFVV